MKSLTDELVATIDSDSSPSDNITTENVETVIPESEINVRESFEDQISYDPLISDGSLPEESVAVSYTHLDVYKRQVLPLNDFLDP